MRTTRKVQHLPVGSFQSPAASGFSGDALLGSVHIIISDTASWKAVRLTTKQRLQRKENCLHAVNGGPFVLTKQKHLNHVFTPER
jgi:hypothetical protein